MKRLIVTADDFGASTEIIEAVVQAHRKLREVCEQTISLTDLYRFPTIAGLADYLSTGGDAAVVPVEPQAPAITTSVSSYCSASPGGSQGHRAPTTSKALVVRFSSPVQMAGRLLQSFQRVCPFVVVPSAVRVVRGSGKNVVAGPANV